MTWNDYLLQYYAERIAQETRPEALKFLRATYNGLKNPDYVQTQPFTLIQPHT